MQINKYFQILKRLERKKLLIVGGSLFIVISLTVTAVLICSRPNEGEILYKNKKYSVSDEEMKEYREMIGNGMDIKKSIFIMFESEEECIAFIEKHGADEHPEIEGQGIIPMMENGYYNIVGKENVEAEFDALVDGEYSKKPVQFSNMFCYLKRIGIESPTEDDESIKEIIRNDKMQNEKRNGD